MLENKQVVADLGSTETVTCSYEVGDPGQNVAWYRVRNGAKINSGGRFELNGFSLKISHVQLHDAGTYECRGAKRQYLTIYVNGKFSLCTFCSSFRQHFFFHLIIMLSCCC